MVGCGSRSEVLAPEPPVADCPTPFARVGRFALAGDEVVAASGGDLIALRKADGARRVVIAGANAREVAANARWVAWSVDGGGLFRARVDGSEQTTLFTPFSGSWETPIPYGLAFDDDDNLLHGLLGDRAVFVHPPSGSWWWTLAASPPVAPLRDAIVAEDGASIVRVPRDGSPATTLFTDELVADPHRAPRSIVADETTTCFTTGRAGLRGVPVQFLPLVRCVSAKATMVMVLGRDDLATLALHDRELFVASAPIADDWMATSELTVNAVRADTSRRVLLHCRTTTAQRQPIVAVDARWVWVWTAAGALFRVAR